MRTLKFNVKEQRIEKAQFSFSSDWNGYAYLLFKEGESWH